MKYMQYKVKDFFSSSKFANTMSVLLAVTLVLILCKGCGATTTDKESAKEIAGLKKEIANLKEDNADLLQIVDSCCCDCNKKKQNTVVKPQAVAKPVQKKPVQQKTVVKPQPVVKQQPIIIRDTIVKVIRDTVVVEPQPVVEEPVDTVAKKTKKIGFEIIVYPAKIKRR